MSVFTMKNSGAVSYQTEAERHLRFGGGKVGSGVMPKARNYIKPIAGSGDLSLRDRPT